MKPKRTERKALHIMVQDHRVNHKQRGRRHTAIYCWFNKLAGQTYGKHSAGEDRHGNPSELKQEVVSRIIDSGLKRAQGWKRLLSHKVQLQANVHGPDERGGSAPTGSGLALGPATMFLQLTTRVDGLLQY